MIKYDLELLKVCANNLMFDMSEEQYKVLLREFDILTKQMEVLADIQGLDEISPMTFPFDVTTTYLREDVFEESITKEEVLRNAKEVVDGQIKLPKVVG
ncbi:MAG: aspartyl/glutamyl-tRNA amidotransferase subunit C [Bacillales bacterium]|nr:aspartyl/glutamyl-tRNA amidotransferase subunit C [Bacillales bacterium]